MPKTEQGVTADRYSIIPRTLIFITRGDNVLLIKGAPTKRLWANRYNGIGGHIERGEDALSAARRELKEETGLEQVHLRLVGTVLIDAGEQRGIGLFVYLGETDQVRLRESHEGALEWVPIESLDEYPLVEDLPLLLPRVLNLARGVPPFSALHDDDARDQLRVHFSE